MDRRAPTAAGVVAKRRVIAVGGAMAALLAVASGRTAEPIPQAGGETVRVAASERYGRNRVHRFVFGGGYRDLWQTPIDLPVLDLAVEAGGLVPTRRYGGLQTPVLGLKGRNGRDYTFRGTDKDPSALLDPLLLDTFVQAVVQDQMAAQHPAGAVVTGVISEAAGVLTFHERLVLMPDTPALGEFRADFGGMVGTFYEFPQPVSETNPGFHGATEIVGHADLYERLSRDPADRVDAHAFLRARLVDILIGDLDRHRKQWRWAMLPGNPQWQPIPEDRDLAFVRYLGLGPRIAHLYVPILQRYGPRYDDIVGLTMHGWEQDRWLLAELEWPEWEAIATDVMARVTDAVIDRAVHAQPPQYVTLDGERLAHDLRGRRDRMVHGAELFYRHLAREVDVHATDAAESATVTREEDGATVVELAVRTGADAVAPPYFRRRFKPGETREVRLYMRGGADRVTVRGAPGPIHLRVIAGDGDGIVDDMAGGGTWLYDATGGWTVQQGPGTRIDGRFYEPPPSQPGFVDVDDIPPRDWGSDWHPLPRFSFENDVGVFLGVGLVHTRYGFRKHPWSNRHVFGAGWAFGASEPRIDYQGRFRGENSRLLAGLDLRVSGIEILRFYGFGNATDNDRPDSFFRVRNQQFQLAPSIDLPLVGELLWIGVGPWIEYSRTKGGDRLIDRLQPYGSGRFGSVGGAVTVRLDTRRSLPDSELNLALPLHPDNPAAGYPLRGVLIDVTAATSPKLWDVDSTWSWVQGTAAAYVSAGDDGRATLALRLGGKQTFGRYPYFGAAYVGGGEFFSGEETLRGYRAQRFGGDASVFGNADVRVVLGRVKLLLPGDLGVLAFGDVGRVFLEGEASSTWHPSWGGGVWFAPLARTNAFSLSVADSPEDTLVYLRNGFHF